jgi:hypothetical protein
MSIITALVKKTAGIQGACREYYSIVLISFFCFLFKNIFCDIEILANVFL